MHEEIKSCPFCGGEATVYSNFSWRSKARFYWVKCLMCGGRGKSIGERAWEPDEPDFESWSAEKAVYAWNQRVGEE